MRSLQHEAITMKIGDDGGMHPRESNHRAGVGPLGRPVAPPRRGTGGRRDVPASVGWLACLVGRVDEASPDPMRAAHVELLRNAVATGRYQPDPHVVARKLLEEVAAEYGPSAGGPRCSF